MVGGLAKAKNSADSSLAFEENFAEVPYYWEMARTKDIAELKEVVSQLLEYEGFGDFCYSRLGESALKEGDGQLLCSDGALSDVMDEYKNKRLFVYDFVLQHLNFRATPIYLSTIQEEVSSLSFDNEFFRQNYEIYRLHAYYGIKDVYCIPVGSFSEGETFSLSVAAKGSTIADFQDLVARKRSKLQALAKAVDYIGIKKYAAVFIEEKSSPIAVTQRPLQLLEVMARENLLLKEAANKLHIGLDTANKHMASVKSAFEAKTPAAAVYRAIKNGIIELE